MLCQASKGVVNNLHKSRKVWIKALFIILVLNAHVLVVTSQQQQQQQ
uniref:Uncharacterized protein n=2 Tax=Myzomyia TaxID=59140 RepID=A0A182WNW1_9DIPT